MLLSKTVKIKWSSNKKYYIDLGYVFTKYGEYFEVKVEDLPKGSHVKVMVQCDKCRNIIQKEYREYIKSHDDVFGDRCSHCAGDKIKHALEENYGGCGLASPIIKAKAEKTNLDKLGVKTPFESPIVYEKLRKTQEEKHGGIGMASESTRRKIEATNEKIRGVKNPSQSEEIKKKKAETMKAHFGVEHIFQDPIRFEEILKKSRETIWGNNNIPTSAPEAKIVQMLCEIYGEDKCFPSYFYEKFVLDCLLVIDSVKIDIEYDGWYWHKNRQEEDKRRNYFLLNRGFKILRIKSLKQLPTKEQLIKAVDNLLNGKHLEEIVLDI